jgi:hypothetical protein
MKMNTTTLSAAATPKMGLRPRITTIHASILILMGSGFAINAIVGGLTGMGMYPFLLTNHIGAVGLLQAYLLMAVVGVSILVGYATAKPLPRAWHWVAIVAHLPPLIAVATFTSSTPEMTINFVLLSLGIHAVGIGAELYAMRLKD